MNRYLLGISICLLAFMPGSAQESSSDCLPIGSSPHRLLLAGLEPGRLMETATGREIDLAAVVKMALKADLIVIGELHDSPACHRFQHDFLGALAASDPDVLVGFEFFETGDDPLLDLYRMGQIDAEELVTRSAWYRRSTLNFGYTQTVLEVVRTHHLACVGLNVSRDVVHTVAGGGLAALSVAQARLFPGVGSRDPQHEYYIRSVFAPLSIQVPAWFENVYAAQRCWDTVMAESMRQALRRPFTSRRHGVIIAGSAHVAYGLGIPWRYRRSDAGVRILTIVPVSVTEKKPGEEENPMLKALAANAAPVALFSRGIGDVVLALPAREEGKYPALGLSGKMEEGSGYRVTGVAKESLAESHGLLPGDLILALDGKPVVSQEDLRRRLSGKKWGDPLSLDLRRNADLQEKKPLK
jgi:uncharacterized iron-regulated protein